MKRIFHYLRPYRLQMSVGLLIKFLGTIAELALPWILSYMIDSVIPTKKSNLLLLWGFFMFLCSVIALAFNIIANRNASMVARNTTEQIRNDLFGKVMYLSNHQVDKITMPSLIARLTTDTYNVHQMLGMMQRLGVRAPIMLIGGLFITLTLDPVLTLVMMAVMPVICILLYFTSKVGVPMYTLFQRKMDRLTLIVREDVAGIRVIKALSKEGYEKKKFEKANLDAVNQDKKAGMVMSVLNPGMNICLNIGTVLVILAGAYRINDGLAQPGVLIAFLTYVTLILNALLFVSRMFTIYSKANASAKRIGEIMDLPEEMTKQNIIKEDNGYHLQFDHVTFSYEGEEKDIKNISFALEKGESLGIIGATGSGKSTLVQLLMRFYDVKGGSIRIDGEDIRTIDQDALREKFGVVFQNDFISTDTIYENIRFGRDMEEDEIMDAASFARASHFIEGKAEGFQTVVAVNGADLSGGQKQRLLISRALATHPEILILDDSSSAPDYKTDADLRKALRDHFQGTTMIMIAQRISSIMGADHILVMDEGQMVGYGKHEELLKTCRIYGEISKSQMGEEPI